MNSKKLSLYILLGGGSILGAFIAKLFGGPPFGGLSILLSATGSLLGIYVWYKLGHL